MRKKLWLFMIESSTTCAVFGCASKIVTGVPQGSVKPKKEVNDEVFQHKDIKKLKMTMHNNPASEQEPAISER